MGTKERRKALLPDSRSPPSNQASTVSGETPARQIWLCSVGSPPNATQVDISDREERVLLSQRLALLQKLAFAVSNQPKVEHKLESKQSLLSSERAFIEASVCTKAPWLDAIATCVPNRLTTPPFQASMVWVLKSFPLGRRSSCCRNEVFKFDLLYAQLASSMSL